jgi:hypothetical protein
MNPAAVTAAISSTPPPVAAAMTNTWTTPAEISEIQGDSGTFSCVSCTDATELL